MSSSESSGTPSPILREGLDWLARLGPGAASIEDRAALDQWRAQSAEHDAAWCEAAAFGAVLREIGHEVIAEGAVAASAPTVVPFRNPHVTRRTLVIGGAIAASATGVLLLGRTLDIVPGIGGPTPDYATGTGERRTIALARGLTLQLDAETSINVGRQGDRHHIDLLAGRAAIVARVAKGAPITVTAREGRTIAWQARFDVRIDNKRSCVTCLAGTVKVEHGSDRVPLTARQQVAYTDTAIERAQAIDPAQVTAWERGELIFHRTPLSEVVREVNRYRPGQVIILNDAVGRRPVNGIFHVAKIESAIIQMQQITGARVTRLPRGIVILS